MRSTRCGTAAIFLAITYVVSGALTHLLMAAAMAPLAFAFDWLDGKVARWRGQHSPMGRELDSLADVASFGVAPASLAFVSGLRGGWDVIVLIYFVCCGVRGEAEPEPAISATASGRVAARDGQAE